MPFNKISLIYGAFKFICFVACLSFAAPDATLGAEKQTKVESTLSLQTQLVAALKTKLAAFREEEKVGQRSTEEILLAVEEYYAELENLLLLKLEGKSPELKRKAQIDHRTELVSELKAWRDATVRRWEVGEVTKASTAAAEAAALRAEIRLRKLKTASAQ